MNRAALRGMPPSLVALAILAIGVAMVAGLWLNYTHLPAPEPLLPGRLASTPAPSSAATGTAATVPGPAGSGSVLPGSPDRSTPSPDLPGSLDPRFAWYSVRAIARIAATLEETTLYSVTVLLDGRRCPARPAALPWGDAVRAGRVLVKASPGEHEVSVRWGARQAGRRIACDAGQLVDVDLVLEAPAAISGRVVDAVTRAGVESALVDVNGARGASDSGGAFLIPYPLVEGGRRLVFASAWHDRYWPTGRQNVEIGGERTDGLVIELRPADAALAIEVRDRAGNLLRDVPVRVSERAPPLGMRADATRDDGRVRVEVPAGAELEVAAGGQGIPPLDALEEDDQIEESAFHIPEVTVPVAPLAPGEERVVTVDLGELWGVDVRVPGGLVLEVHRNGQRVCRSLPRAEDRVVPLTLPGGDYRLTLVDGTAPIAAQDVTVAGPLGLDLTYEVAAPITGEVVAAPGVALPGGVGLEPLGIEDDLVPAARLVPIDDEGRFRFDHLQPGRYRIVPPDGYALESSPIVETSAGGEPPRLVIRALER